ncbi:protein-glutamate methylesterase/protein-glutamine glutaminase [Sphingomonas rubra]|uniref:Protein-glutamate methylesterase/protein-glutamine glutaminase n=1 Tax=Sphingomonas rubra TaxID=634430 RepID=A0A1I5SN30_9SPHN|nr:chemotaxis response regulator protein-glutamate methylesterase [Sphingomonas rubra]SFP72162.1 two-component system, chemotaxis family, response regulator CheB [Sphingomonas rubra]
MTVRTLIVDDSPAMTAMIRRKLAAEPGIEVIGTAADAHEARAQIKALDPDVVTLDIEMPGINGLDFLERLMRLRPTPVVMLSTLTSQGAEASIAALELGAFDCFDKARLNRPLGSTSAPSLADLLRAAARSRPHAPAARAAAPARPTSAYAPHRDRMIAIGASTGGVEALIALLMEFPANCPPTVIVQHMPESFTPSFAARLHRLCQPTVEEARPGAVLEVGKIYLAPGGGRHLEIGGTDARRYCRLVEDAKVNGHRPSVDRLFHSVAKIAGANAVGAILAGMGNDGAAGLKAMRATGSITFGQDEATSVVYGMPAVAYQIGAVAEQLPLRRIAPRLLAECRA